MTEAKVNISDLLFHLRNCPDEFLKSSVLSKGGSIHTNPLLKDVYRKIIGDPSVVDSILPDKEANDKLDSNHLSAIHIGCWFFSHPSFAGAGNILTGIEDFLFYELQELSPHVKHLEWIRDEDRAEEFVRIALKSCNLHPRGEKDVEAMDRLDALSTLKRRNVLQESNAAFQKIKEIRQKMAEAKAREAANVYGRE